MAEIRREWSATPIGYRDAQLESPDFTAAMALFVAGIPTLLIGAEMAGLGIGLGQLVLAVPLGALIGALIIGLLGRLAAASGAPGAYLMRASLGSLGGSLLALIRLGLTLAWAALILQIGGRWAASALGAFGVSIDFRFAMIPIAVLAIIVFISGPAWSVRMIMRRRIFWPAMLMVVLAGWLVLSGDAPLQNEVSRGGLIEVFDALLGLAVVWATIGGDIGCYGHREDDAASGLGLGYGIGALVFVLAGAVLASRSGGDLMTVTGIGPGLVGAVVLLVWIPLMEVDGLAGLSASSAWSLQTVAGGIPARILVVLTGGMGLALAWFTTPETVRMIADLGVSLITPALSIALVDAYLVAEEPYSADKLFRWRSDYGWLNLVGLMSWIVGCGLALWLRPRPAFAPVWLDSMLPSAPTGWPGLFIAGFGAGLAYLSLGKLLRVGRSRRQRMRRF